MSICLISMLAGALLCVWAPVVQFALGLLLVALTGAILAAVLGAPFWSVLLWSAALYACAQIGYGLGMAAIVLYRVRRPHAAARSALPSLHKPFLK